MMRWIALYIPIALSCVFTAPVRADDTQALDLEKMAIERQALWKKFYATQKHQKRRELLRKIIRISQQLKALLQEKNRSQLPRPANRPSRGAPHIGSAGNPNPSAPPQLASRLEKLADGLLYTSESDYPYKKFHRAMKPETKLTAKSFRHVMGLAESVEVSVEPVSSFFKDPPVYEEAEKARYAKLEKFMRANLTDLRIVHVGGEDVVEGEVYILGRAADGSLVGLKTKRIWT